MNNIITSYKSVKEEAESSEHVINKSRFIGYAKHAMTEKDALEFIGEVSCLHPEASCICHAYICGMNMEVQKFHNGHEPVGGMPILEVMKLKKLTAVCCAVVRYYGGIKLGVGGLARAFSTAAAEAINMSDPAVYELSEKLTLTIDYTFQGKIEYMLRNSVYVQDNMQYGEKINMDILTKKSMKKELEAKISAITNGNHKLVLKDTVYYCWDI